MQIGQNEELFHSHFKDADDDDAEDDDDDDEIIEI
jgi:hypothetical protein